MRLHQRLSCGVADALPATANGDFGPEAEQALGDPFAEPGAPAGDENLLAREQALAEHCDSSLS
jgi:hypothetical protein